MKENVSVANNACWAIDEVVIKVETCLHILAYSCRYYVLDLLYPTLKQILIVQACC